MIDPLLLTAVRVTTFMGRQSLTNATGFFFERGSRLFLVTSRHVMIDKANGHAPDRVEIDLHTDLENMARYATFSIPLYRDGTSIWRQGTDSAGEIDLAVIELERQALPSSTVYRAFTPEQLHGPGDRIEIGAPLLVVGFPLGFQDTLHRMPVVRHAIVASSFGLRFQGKGYFLTDARTHSGISGAPVVVRAAKNASKPEDLPWMLLGVHSSRIDMGTRDLAIDESLGLNCAWYADMLLTLTED